MYWQFLPCHVSGTRDPVIIEHEKGWPFCTHNMDVRMLVPPPFPPLPLPAPAVVLSRCLDPLGLVYGPRHARLLANLMNVEKSI